MYWTVGEGARGRSWGEELCNSVESQQRRQCADTDQDEVTRTGSEVCSRAARVRDATPSNMLRRKAGTRLLEGELVKRPPALGRRPVNVISLSLWGSGEGPGQIGSRGQLLHGRHVVEANVEGL